MQSPYQLFQIGRRLSNFSGMGSSTMEFIRRESCESSRTCIGHMIDVTYKSLGGEGSTVQATVVVAMVRRKFRIWDCLLRLSLPNLWPWIWGQFIGAKYSEHAKSV